MTIKERYKGVISYFSLQNPEAETELIYDNPYQLLVAVILSAQCTDKRVNLTTPNLFKKYSSIKELSKAKVEDVVAIIKSISYPNSKAKHLVGMANKVLEDFNGEIPMTVMELTTLPGVGRKTANVITSVIEGQPNMAVDTHVFRVANRIGLTANAKTPLQSETQLIKHIPEELVHKAHHWLILHGRYVCTARSPKCQECGISNYCKSFGKLKH